MKFKLLILLIMYSTCICFAQEDTIKKQEGKNKQISTPEIFGLQSKGHKYSIFERTFFPNLKELNKALTAGGFKKVIPIHPALGMELLLYNKNKSFARAEFYKSIFNIEKYKDTVVCYDLSGFSYLYSSYLINRPKVNFVLLWGVNHSWLKLNIEQFIAEDTQFSDVVISKGNQLGLKISTWNAAIGGQMNFLISRRALVLIFGINAGYYHPFTKTSTSWKMQIAEVELKNGPRINPNGFFAGVNISVLFSAEARRFMRSKLGFMSFRLHD
ncbi:MAG: hypothetical protein HY738_21400 [Bacteroidia bacterium]|nr:hypothetical protein [Bacteroidia bacterium]